MSGWVGATAAVLKPLVDALATDVLGADALAGDNLHVDDTPVPQYGHRAPARSIPAGFGPMSMTSGHSPACDRRQRCSSTRPTVKGSICRRI